MTNSIPASQLVNVVPSVLGTGGNPLSLNAVFLTNDPSIPVGTVMAFASLEDVQNWFGPSSVEATLAAVYFAGFSTASTLPGTLYFTQYNSVAVGGYLRSGSFAGVALSVIQAISGVLDITVDGEAVISGAINLSGATSYSNAAALIQAALQTTGSVFTGTGSQATNVLTIASTVTGALHVGDTVTGAGVFGGTATITSFGTYTVLAGTGTVNVSTSGTQALGAVDVTSTATCVYDALRAAFVIESGTTGVNSSVSFATGGIAAALQLTAATGAVKSAGAAAATPASAMNAVVAATQNWATFMTVFEPITSVKLAFAAWVSGQSPAGNERFLYVAWDSDLTPAAGAASGSFGAQVGTLQYNGVAPVWDQTNGTKAAFICGTTASIDYEATQGRITYAYKNQAGLVTDVTDATMAANLIGNGYNFYGAYATANQAFSFLQPGSTPGEWKWIDAYVNQIWFNAALQLAYMELLAQVKSIPYNNSGYALLRAAGADPIAAAINAGVIQPGVPLSLLQQQEVNTAAGANIATTLTQLGYYLQILPADSITRGTRGSPPMTLWYTDGGSIQKINLASIDVQ